MKINQYFITNDDSILIDAANFCVNKMDDNNIYSHDKLKVDCLLLNYNQDERKTITLNLLEQSLEDVTDFQFNPKTWKDTVKKVIFYE